MWILEEHRKQVSGVFICSLYIFVWCDYLTFLYSVVWEKLNCTLRCLTEELQLSSPLYFQGFVC